MTITPCEPSRQSFNHSQDENSDHSDISRRHMEIFNKFDGKNQEQLAGEYKMTVARVELIIKMVRVEMILKRQKGLLPGSAG